jgi:hypothetical protein
MSLNRETKQIIGYLSTKCFKAPSPLTHKNGKRRASKQRRRTIRRDSDEQVAEATKEPE